MGRCAGDDFKRARVLKFSERVKQVRTVMILKNFPNTQKMSVIHLGERIEPRLGACPLHLLRTQLNQFRQVTAVTLLKERISQHRSERGRDGHRDLKGNPLLRQSLKKIDQGNVTLRNRFEEPALFQEIFVLGMAHEGKMGVKNKKEITFFHKRKGGTEDLEMNLRGNGEIEEN